MKTVNNYHDLIIRKDIESAVKFYNSTSKYSHPFYGKTVDEAIEIWKDKAKKTSTIEESLCIYRDNGDLMGSDDDLLRIKALLEHPERDRLRLIHDGSYYTHRINVVYIDNTVCVIPTIFWSSDEFRNMDDQLNSMEPSDQIDYLFNNFEVVYIQMGVVKDRKDIERLIRDDD